MLQNLFTEQQNQKLLNDLFQAYYDARKNKRNTINALAFEKELEANLFSLYTNIIERKYTPMHSICFMVNKPVKREIFAANFRDRVVHHLIYNYISPIFEKSFIHDSYSCRKGKGTHYGIKRIDHFIRSCSQNYTKDCYILKLDIQGYFMSINKEMLYRKVERQLLKQKHSLNFDLLLVLYLLQVTIFNNPVENCVVKGKRSDWKGLPNSKSLFHAESGLGLPIGNLTSQLFGNVYLNAFDHFVKRELKIKYYGRYVDDFILIHSNKAFLVNLIPIIRKYLKKELELTLHPNKIYLQHYSKGVKYLGAVIKPHRIYIANRTKGNFYESIQKHNVIARDHKPSKKERKEFASCMNSYLGIMQHYKTYNIRKTMVNKEVSGWWWNYLTIQNNYRKYQLKS